MISEPGTSMMWTKAEKLDDKERAQEEARSALEAGSGRREGSKPSRPRQNERSSV